jgi:glycerol kinase
MEGSTMTKYVLGIDQGTTGTKAVVFDRQGSIVATAYSEFTQYFPQPGWVEHDANEIWEVSMGVVAQALKNGNISPEQIAAIGITNQRETTTFWNKKTGQPVGRSIVWQDRRTLPICEALAEKDKAGIEDRTGMIIVPNDAATKIRWLLDNDPKVREGVDKGELIYGTIDTWMIWKLSGGAAHVTDYSNTSVTLLLNARKLDYDEWILNELQIPRQILPALKSSSEIYAYTDPQAFFGVRVPISGDAGDQQAAVMGQACIKPGMAKNTYGTGSFMILNTGTKYVPPVGGLFSPVLWAIKDEVAYGLEGMADVSGAAIQWLRDGLGIIQESSDAEVLAAQVADTQGVYFVPAFVGLGAPHFDSYARGTMLGITRGTTRQHVARAALEAMAYQTRDSFEIMKRESGLDLNMLRVDGGGAKSDFLMQFQADILGIPVERPVVTETTVLGAAYLAGLAVGYWQSVDEIAANWQIERRFDPNLADDRREELYHGWQKAIKHAAGWLKG